MKKISDYKIRLQNLIVFIFQENLNTILCCLVLAVVGVFVYRNAFGAPFIFDDFPQILQNHAVQSLQWPWTFLENNRRPLLYASLAFNFNHYGFNAFGFHAFNIRVHILEAMFLFLIIRKTCLLSSMKTRTGKDATLLALSASLLWLVHPLHTQAVTYIIQRAESLMGLLFLMTLFFSILYFESRKWYWLLITSLCSLMCGLTKEVALVLPLSVLWYERTFISSSFQEALRKNFFLYLGLSVTWLAMFYLYFTTQPEEKLTAGFGMHGMTPWQYALNQPMVILHYLRLALWPNPLIFDYEWPVITDMTHLFPSIVGLLGVLGVLLAAYRIYPVFSFLGSIFFIILAPSSSIIPLKDLIFEYRVYLSLSVVAIGATYLIKIGVARWIHPKSQKAFFMTVIGVLVLLLGGITYQRNKIYLSEETVWLDVIAKRPMNARAYNNLGEYYLRQGKNTEAKANFSKSISLNTSYADVFANMATVLGKEGKLEDAITFAKAAIEIQPDFAIGYNNLGSVLNQLGRYAEAVPYFEKTLKLGFYEEGVLQNLGVALANSGHPRRAILVLREALRINPSSVESKNVLDQIQTSLEKNPAP